MELFKPCTMCKSIKALSEFEKRKEGRDGYRNQYIPCRKSRQKINYEHRKLARQRVSNRAAKVKKYPQKAHEIYVRQKVKYPEKLKARSASRSLNPPYTGAVRHHWSYNKCNFKDCLWMNHSDHKLIHRFLVYDRTLKLYRSTDGVLLDPKSKHEEYINRIILNKDYYDSDRYSTRNIPNRVWARKKGALEQATDTPGDTRTV